MSTLRFFDLNKYICKYGLVNFIETGTFYGDSLDYAINFSMKEYWSIEYYKETYDNVLPKYLNKSNVHVINGHSPEVLAKILPKIKEPILFWLDAHFTPDNRNLSEIPAEILMPLKKEMEIILSSRNGEDVILIDDFQMFWEGRFGYLADKFYDESFLNAFRDKYIINEYRDDTGYLEMIPKKELLK